MTDRDVMAHINELVNEEHELHARAEQRALTEEERQRLQELNVSLDQCWDLLRQRRALREFNRDSDDARVRDANTVERYLQ